MYVTPLPIVILFKDRQTANAPLPILVTPLPMLAFVIHDQSKAPSPLVRTLSGIVRLLISHSWNAFSPISRIVLAKVTFVNVVNEKAYSAILVTPLEIVYVPVIPGGQSTRTVRLLLNKTPAALL